MQVPPVVRPAFVHGRRVFSAFGKFPPIAGTQADQTFEQSQIEMIKMSKITRSYLGSIWNRSTTVPALLTLLVLACAISSVEAATPPPTFDLKIDRDLAHLNDPTAISNHSGAFIDAQNNRPFLQLTNLVDTPLTTFEMTVANPSSFHFADLPQGAANIVKTPSGVTVTPTFLLDGDKLKLDFGPGLDKNESVQFQIRLGADACPSCGPSFQVALFNICHDAVPMGTPGTLSVNGGPPSTWIVDFPTHFVDGYYAPTSTSSVLNPPITESAGSDQPTVPEPSGLLLSLLALCGITQSCAVRRRRAQR
jgi:hypothetical protein